MLRPYTASAPLHNYSTPAPYRRTARALARARSA
jgi:hypothetical protein